MVWFVVWLVGLLIIFFTPMATGDTTILEDGWLAKLILIGLFWPALLFLAAIVFMFEYGGRAFSWCYMWPTKKMAKFWDQRKQKS